jgi:peptide/nickel transport system permease protein
MLARPLFRFILQLVLSVFGIILLASLPYFIQATISGEYGWRYYGEAIVQIVYSFIHPLQQTVTIGDSKQLLLPVLMDRVIYSLTILFCAIVFAFLLAVLLAIISMLFPYNIRKKFSFFLYLLESLPDLLVIVSIQMFIVFIFKKTGILLSSVATLGEQQIYVLPIVCLSILPTIMLYRHVMVLLEDEWRKDYVTLAHSIGLKRVVIVVKHIFRNVVVSLFFQSKKTIWFMLSNLFVIEYFFNLGGIATFLKQHLHPVVFSYSMIAIFLPIFIIYTFGEWCFRKMGLIRI